MAEEEQGFTFVDKRRNAPEAAPEDVPETVAAVREEASEEVSEASEEVSEASDVREDALDEFAAAPTTYDLIGYCINLLASQAWQKLGLLADPQTGEAQPDLAEAKVAIDTVGDLAARLDAAPEIGSPFRPAARPADISE